MQLIERNEKHAEVLSYEVGGERVDEKTVDEYFKIYNQSERDVYLETVDLKANMGDGSFRLVHLYAPNKPKELHPGDFKEFRFRCPLFTPADRAAESQEQYRSFTGQSVIEATTTRGTRLTFDSSYHPYFLDRLKRALDGSKPDDNGLLKVP